MGLGELALAALALNALGGKRASSPSTPAHEPSGGAGQGGGDHTVQDVAGAAGGAVGTLLTQLLHAGGGAAAPVAAPAAAPVAAAPVESAAVAGGFSGLTLGAGLTLGWAAFFVLQFVVMDVFNTARTAWLRYQDSVFNLNRPFLHLHRLEVSLVTQTLDQLGLSWTGRDADDSAVVYAGYPHSSELGRTTEDPRLTWVTRTTDGFSQEYTSHPRTRTIIDNPFPSGRASELAVREENWRVLQMAARLVASRYVVELGRYGRGMLRNMLNLGGVNVTALNDSYADVWSYPLVGGGQPDKTYAAMHDELRLAGTFGGFTIDDVLNAAKLAAVIHAAQVTQTDPSIYAPWNPAVYSTVLYTSMGLTEVEHRIRLDGQLWHLDPTFYKLPCSRCWLDLDLFCRAAQFFPPQPFVPGTNPAVPTPFSATSMRAIA